MKIKQKQASTVASALTARSQLGQILRRVKTGNERFIIGRRGEPQAILMSIEDDIDTVAPAPDWLKSAWDEAKKNGTDKLTMREIDSIIAEDRAELAKKATRARGK
jgi:prevent-host-death family protein